MVTVGKDDGGGGTAGSVSTTEGTEEAAPSTTEVPEVNPVVVVEQGFSSYTTDEGPHAGYGFILQNTGPDIVRSVDTTVTLYGAGDTEVWEGRHTVDMLRPGEKTGYGDEIFGSALGGATVERIEVVVPYIPKAVEDPSTIPDGAFQVGDIRTESSALFLHTTFSISTTYPTNLIFPVGYAIYRNSAGQIIGGASTTGLVAPDGAVPGEAKISTWSIFPDFAAAEVYIDPGLITP